MVTGRTRRDDERKARAGRGLRTTGTSVGGGAITTAEAVAVAANEERTDRREKSAEGVVEELVSTDLSSAENEVSGFPTASTGTKMHLLGLETVGFLL